MQKAVVPVVLPYRAKATYDGQRYELDMPALEIPRCTACGELVFSTQVDEQTTQALRAALHLLTPEQIQQARTRLGLDPQELADRLGITPETLARWEAGTVLQPRALDNLLRVFFALPEVRALLTVPTQILNLGSVLGPSSP